MNKYEYYIYIVYVKLIYTSFLLFRYIIAPNGQNVTKEFLETGTYHIEVRRKKYPAKMYLRSPFDPQNKRLLGVYTI